MYTDKEIMNKFNEGKSLISLATGAKQSTTAVVMRLIKLGANQQIVDWMIKHPRAYRTEVKLRDRYIVHTVFNESTPNPCRLLVGQKLKSESDFKPHCEGCQCYLMEIK